MYFLVPVPILPLYKARAHISTLETGLGIVRTIHLVLFPTYYLDLLFAFSHYWSLTGELNQVAKPEPTGALRAGNLPLLLESYSYKVPISIA